MKRLLFLILVLAMVAMLGTCSGGGGGGGDGDDDGGGTPTPITGAHFPADVEAFATGDYSECMDMSCILANQCLSSCFSDFSQQFALLNPDDPDFLTSFETLSLKYESCMRQCDIDNPGCDIESPFTLSLVMTNRSTGIRTITLPAGIIFVPGNSEYQQMMLIEEVEIVIGSGETKTVCLPVYCIDSNLDAPDEAAEYTTYSIVDPVDGGCLPGILDSVRGVNFQGLSTEELNGIQDVIWTCRDYGDIEAADQAFLDGLPRIGGRFSRAASHTEVKIPMKWAGAHKSQFSR